MSLHVRNKEIFVVGLLKSENIIMPYKIVFWHELYLCYEGNIVELLTYVHAQKLVKITMGNKITLFHLETKLHGLLFMTV